jgi:hypothetical protein
MILLRVIKLLVYVVRQKYAMSPSVKDFGDAFEVLLASSVPYLQFEYFVFNSDHKRTKFNANCDFVFVSEFVFGNS